MLKSISFLPHQLIIAALEYVLVAIALGVQAVAGVLLGLFVWEWKRGRVVRYHRSFLVVFICVVLGCVLVSFLWYPCEACNFLGVLTFSVFSIAQSFAYFLLS